MIDSYSISVEWATLKTVYQSKALPGYYTINGGRIDVELWDSANKQAYISTIDIPGDDYTDFDQNFKSSFTEVLSIDSLVVLKLSGVL